MLLTHTEHADALTKTAAARKPTASSSPDDGDLANDLATGGAVARGGGVRGRRRRDGGVGGPGGP